MEKVRFQLPRLGVTDAPPLTEQDGQVCPPSAMRNAWPRERAAKRYNLSTRDKISRILDATGAGAGSRVQCIGVVGTASGVTGFDNTNPTEITAGTSRVSGKFFGQAVVLDADWTVRQVLRDTRGTGATMSAPPASVGGYGGFGCCWHSTDSTVGYIACIGQDTGQTTDANTITFIARFDLDTPDSFTHTAYCVDRDAPYTAPISGAQEPITVSKMVQYGPYLFVAANRYIYVFRADNLTYLKRVQAAFSIEVQDIACVTVGDQDWLLAGISGSAAISGAVVEDAGADPKEAWGEFYRSAISLYQIQYADATLKTPLPVGGNAIRRWPMPQGTETGDPGYEDHRTFRPSEYGVQAPRGGIIYSIAVDATTGDVFGARTAQGWGFNGTATDGKPNGTVRDVTLFRAKLGAAYTTSPTDYVDPIVGTNYGLRRAIGAWEIDTESYKRAYRHGTTTYQTDIPQIVGSSRNPGPGTAAEGYSDAPSAFAVAYNAALDVVCVGGRRPSISSANVHGVRGLDGAIAWRTKLGGMVLQNSIAASPSRGTFVVGTVRNADWDTSAGAWAELFELDAATGTIRRTFDLTNAVMNNGVYDFTANPAPVSLYAGSYAVAVHPTTGRVLVALAPFRHSA